MRPKSKREKAVVVVRSGPGTGKSVIALNLLGMLCARQINAEHATGSKAFTENIRKVLGPRSKSRIRYFNNYGDAEPGSIDVLIADEAHRIAHRAIIASPRKRRSQNGPRSTR